MKTKELKTIWKLAKNFYLGGFIFWLLETIVFLIIEGWHYKAVNPIEIYCDRIVHNMWLFSLQCTGVCCVYWLFNLNKSIK